MATGTVRTCLLLFVRDSDLTPEQVSKKEMREAVQRIYRERKTLAAGLRDSSRFVHTCALYVADKELNFISGQCGREIGCCLDWHSLPCHILRLFVDFQQK